MACEEYFLLGYAVITLVAFPRGWFELTPIQGLNSAPKGSMKSAGIPNQGNFCLVAEHAVNT